MTLSPTHPRRARPPVWLIALAVSGATLAFAGVMTYSLWGLIFPPGEPIASLDLRTPAPVAAVTLGAGDKLTFRADVASKGFYLKTELRRVILTARLQPVAGPGPERTTSCAIYDGGASSSSSGFSGSKLTGTTNDCELRADAAGQYFVRTQAAWGAVTPTEARLEVRRVPAKLGGHTYRRGGTTRSRCVARTSRP